MKRWSFLTVAVLVVTGIAAQPGWLALSVVSSLHDKGLVPHQPLVPPLVDPFQALRITIHALPTLFMDRDIRPPLVVVGGVGEEDDRIVHSAHTVIMVRAYQAGSAPDQQAEERKKNEVAHDLQPAPGAFEAAGSTA